MPPGPGGTPGSGVLRIERLDPASGEWRFVAELGPADLAGSITDNAADGGRRDVIWFECCGGHSMIRQGGAGGLTG
jgi:hypothetical protein